MPKIKETRVPLKGESPRKAPKASETKRKAAHLSQEVVVESDSQGSRASSTSGRSSGSESDREKRRNTKKPRLQKTVDTEPADPPVPDDSSEEGKSSEEASNSSDIEANNVQDPARTPKANGKKNDSEKKDSGGSDSSEVSDDSEEEEQPNAQTATTTTATSAPEIPPPPFKAPPGYSAIDITKDGARTLASLFGPNSSSKQIWHITAPAGLPISQVESVTLAQIQQTHSLLSHGGSNYSLVDDKHKSDASIPQFDKRVFVPAPNGRGYSAVEIPVSRTLHFEQIIELPNLSNKQADPARGSTAAGDTSLPPVRGPKPQPKGLRMRFKPPGFGKGRPGAIGADSSDEDDDGDVDMEDVEARPTFRLPQAQTTAVERGKKTSDEAETTQHMKATPQTQKKRKKDDLKKAKDNEKEPRPDRVTNGNGTDAMVTRAEEALVEGTKDEVPKPPEEEARLEEEKRLRKEERRLKRERKEERKKKRETKA